MASLVSKLFVLLVNIENPTSLLYPMIIIIIIWFSKTFTFSLLNIIQIVILFSDIYLGLGTKPF